MKMKNMWFKIFMGLPILGGLCGIAALLLFFYLIPIETIVSVDKVEYIYEKLSLHMWFLEVILLVAGLAAAVLAFVGYQSIKEEAVRKAVERAEQETREFLKTADISDKKFDPVDSPIQPEPSEEGE